MKFLHQNLLLGAAATLLLTGCIDDNYDLSNVDTTSEFRVNDLVLPLNLEPVELHDIIKVEEGDQLHEVTIDGYTFYAVDQTGSITSDGMDIEPVVSTVATMNPTEATFRPKIMSSVSKKRAGNDIRTYFLIQEVYEDLKYEDDNVDGTVRYITSLGYKPLKFRMDLQILSDLRGITSELENIELAIPAGLSIVSITAPGYTFHPGDYNALTGELSIDHISVNDDMTTSIEITSNGINFDLPVYTGPNVNPADRPYVYNPATKKGKFQLNSQFSILKSDLIFTADLASLNNIPEELNFRVTYKVDDLEATTLTGDIQYDLDPGAISPVELTNLPDFLDDPETNLMLSNPQIYLKLQNPISKYGLKYEAKLEITPERENQASQTISSPMIVVPVGDYDDIYFVLAPDPDNVSNGIPEGYNPKPGEDLKKLTYNNLGDILKGEGLPQRLDIKISDAQIPEQRLLNPLEFDTRIEGMEGSYYFLAPLSLKEGSEIVKTVDGWWTEDLADLNIDHLTISADAFNGLSTGVLVEVYAIDQNRKQISTTGTVKLERNAQNAPIEITLTGLDGKPINNLDGIQLYVIAGENNGEPLAPDQYITLENLKAKVTGNYTRKL